MNRDEQGVSRGLREEFEREYLRMMNQPVWRYWDNYRVDQYVDSHGNVVPIYFSEDDLRNQAAMNMQSTHPQAPDGDVVFKCGQREVLRLCADGVVMLNGKEVANDVEIVSTFKQWCKEALKYKLTGETVFSAGVGSVQPGETIDFDIKKIV